MKRMRWDALADRLLHDRPIVGAEVGVWNGKMSEQMLKRFPLLTLIMVDRWEPPQPSDSYYDSGSSYARMGSADYDKAMDDALYRTSEYSDRRIVLMAESKKAAALLRADMLDFAFIDADHSYHGVMMDLCAWLPNMKPGGLICGHDYDHPEQGEVKQAVNDRLQDMPGIIELDANRTWFYRIPEVL